MQADLGIGWCGLWRRSALTDNQFPWIYTDLFIFKNVIKCQCPLDGNRHLPTDIRFIKFSQQPGPFHRDGWFGIQALLPQLMNPLVHFYPPILTSNPAFSNCSFNECILSLAGSSIFPALYSMPSRSYLCAPIL